MSRRRIATGTWSSNIAAVSASQPLLRKASCTLLQISGPKVTLFKDDMARRRDSRSCMSRLHAKTISCGMTSRTSGTTVCSTAAGSVACTAPMCDFAKNALKSYAADRAIGSTTSLGMCNDKEKCVNTKNDITVLQQTIYS